MYHYAQIKQKRDGYGYIISDSYLSGEVSSDNMILITDHIDYDTHRWNYETKEWEAYTPEPGPEPQPAMPTNQDIMDKLDAMSVGQVSSAELDAAYREGVNSYE